jgi:hypothetical protein
VRNVSASGIGVRARVPHPDNEYEDATADVILAVVRWSLWSPVTKEDLASS